MTMTVMVGMVVVKLLRTDKISTSWRKTIGREGKQVKAGRRDRGLTSPRKWNEGKRGGLREGGFDNCNPLSCRDISRL